MLSVLLLPMQGLLTTLCCSHACHMLFVFCCCLCKVCSLDCAVLTLVICSLFCCCLCKVCSLDSAALTLAMCSLFCCCLCNIWSLDSAALLHAFCNLSLAIMTDFMLSGKVTRNRFMALAGKVCSICRLAWNTCWQDLHTFSLI